jgi:hypothetical protein
VKAIINDLIGNTLKDHRNMVFLVKLSIIFELRQIKCPEGQRYLVKGINANVSFT